ncbi:MAG: diguanylate cyclase [Atopobiaceae bacterium]|nr:diguanylate cyclase [Atopobiaceae bacterium]
MNKLFISMVAVCALAIIGDGISRCYIFEGFPALLVIAGTYFNYIAIPAIGIMWYWYVRRLVDDKDKPVALITDKIIIVLMILAFAVLLLNPFTHMVFSFDDSGLYQRGPLYFFPAGAAFWCIILSEGYLLSIIKSLGHSTGAAMLFFPVPPVIGAFIAAVLYGLPWMLLGMSLSMLVLFSTLQTTSLDTDHLTSALSRKRVEEVLDEHIARAQAGPTFAGIILDINDFKSINDNYGHIVGDDALSQTADILRSCTRLGDIVARIGGDEFFVLLEIQETSHLEHVVERIHNAVDRFNNFGNPYELSFSMGYDIYRPELHKDRESFVAKLDELMYREKQAHHELAVGAL